MIFSTVFTSNKALENATFFYCKPAYDWNDHKKNDSANDSETQNYSWTHEQDYSAICSDVSLDCVINTVTAWSDTVF